MTKIEIFYSYKDLEFKSLEVEYSDTKNLSEIDRFVIQAILKKEEPELSSLGPLISDQPFNSTERQFELNNKQLEEFHHLTISYKIGSTKYCIAS